MPRLLACLKWLPEWPVRVAGTIYFLVYFWTHGMYPHETATMDALKRRGLVPRENTRVHIGGWKDRDDDDFGTSLPHDIYNYMMPHALFFDPDDRSGGSVLTISLSVFSTRERDAERAKQRAIDERLDVLLHATPPHSALYDSRRAELDALHADLKNVCTTVALTLPAHRSATEFLVNYAERDAQAGGVFFMK